MNVEIMHVSKIAPNITGLLMSFQIDSEICSSKSWNKLIHVNEGILFRCVNACVYVHMINHFQHVLSYSLCYSSIHHANMSV